MYMCTNVHIRLIYMCLGKKCIFMDMREFVCIFCAVLAAHALRYLLLQNTRVFTRAERFGAKVWATVC